MPLEVLNKWSYIPRAELATRSISTVFKASGLCLAFSFLLVASTWKIGKRVILWEGKRP
jgi:hypothetical protein